MTQNYEPYTPEELDDMGAQSEIQCRLILAQILHKLNEVGWSGRRPTTLEEFRGNVPFQGWGTTDGWTW